MGQIEPDAMKKLMAPHVARQQEELARTQKALAIARARRTAGAQFDIQQAMSRGDMEGVQKLQTEAKRAAAIDRASEQGLLDAHSAELMQTARRERDNWDVFTNQGGVGGYGGDGVKRAGDVFDLPASMAHTMTQPSFDQRLADAETRRRGSGDAALAAEDFVGASGPAVDFEVKNSQRAAAEAVNKPRLAREAQWQQADAMNAVAAGKQIAEQRQNEKTDTALHKFFDPAPGSFYSSKAKPFSPGGTITRGGAPGAPAFDTEQDDALDQRIPEQPAAVGSRPSSPVVPGMATPQVVASTPSKPPGTYPYFAEDIGGATPERMNDPNYDENLRRGIENIDTFGVTDPKKFGSFQTMEWLQRQPANIRPILRKRIYAKAGANFDSPPPPTGPKVAPVAY